MSEPGKALSTDQEYVRDWCWRHGPAPTDEQFRNAIHAYTFDWLHHRRDGLHTLASYDLEDLRIILTAMKDLCP